MPSRQREIPAVRVMPMSDKIEGFRTLSIEDVQKKCFHQHLPKTDGRFRYRSSGLDAEVGTIVLFQFKARVIASAMFLRDEKYDKPINGLAGAIYVDVASIRTFDPVDVETMRKAWPSFRAFGHVKHRLNPTRYVDFTKLLKHVKRVNG